MGPTLPLPARLRGASPADLVTAFRAVLVVAVAAILVTALLTGGATRTWWVAWLGIAAWALDALDGYVARRTGTASARGALLDSGVDGSLVLVLSLVHLGLAPWALAGGLLWPAFVAVQAVRPAWRRTLPHSARRKVVGGTLTGTLAIGAAPLWPDALVQVAVAVAVLGVTWSFARDVRWLEQAAAAVAPRAPAS